MPQEKPKRYKCPCGRLIYPEMTWSIETLTPGEGLVVITYHCHCLPVFEASSKSYPFDQDAVLYLMAEHADRAERLGGGQWCWENPVRLRSVFPGEWPLRDAVNILKRHIHTVKDFLDACNGAYSDTPESWPGEGPSPLS